MTTPYALWMRDEKIRFKFAPGRIVKYHLAQRQGSAHCHVFLLGLVRPLSTWSSRDTTLHADVELNEGSSYIAHCFSITHASLHRSKDEDIPDTIRVAGILLAYYVNEDEFVDTHIMKYILADISNTRARPAFCIKCTPL